MSEQLAPVMEPGPKRRRNGRGRVRFNGRINLSLKEVTRDSTLERFKRTRATAQLRMALAPHQEVVKLCVAERLCHHKDTAALARDLKLTEDQVKEILARMRPWVHRYTTYFDSDWYWLDNGLPALPEMPGNGH